MSFRWDSNHDIRSALDTIKVGDNQAESPASRNNLLRLGPGQDTAKKNRVPDCSGSLTGSPSGYVDLAAKQNLFPEP